MMTYDQLSEVHEWMQRWNQTKMRSSLSFNHLRDHKDFIYEPAGGILLYRELIDRPICRIVDIIINPQKVGTGVADRLLGKLIQMCLTKNIKIIAWNIKEQNYEGFVKWAKSVGFIEGEIKESQGNVVKYTEYKLVLQ